MEITPLARFILILVAVILIVASALAINLHNRQCSGVDSTRTQGELIFFIVTLIIGIGVLIGVPLEGFYQHRHSKSY